MLLPWGWVAVGAGGQCLVAPRGPMGALQAGGVPSPPRHHWGGRGHRDTRVFPVMDGRSINARKEQKGGGK